MKQTNKPVAFGGNNVKAKQSFRQFFAWLLAQVSMEQICAAGQERTYVAAMEYYERELGTGNTPIVLETLDYHLLLAASGGGASNFVVWAELCGISAAAAKGKFKKLLELGLVRQGAGGGIETTPWGKCKLAQWEANGREVV